MHSSQSLNSAHVVHFAWRLFWLLKQLNEESIHSIKDFTKISQRFYLNKFITFLCKRSLKREKYSEWPEKRKWVKTSAKFMNPVENTKNRWCHFRVPSLPLSLVVCHVFHLFHIFEKIGFVKFKLDFCVFVSYKNWIKWAKWNF